MVKEGGEKMYCPSILPPAGGGLVVGITGLIAGYVLNNWLIIGISLLIMFIILFCFIRLQLGERKIRKKKN